MLRNVLILTIAATVSLPLSANSTAIVDMDSCIDQAKVHFKKGLSETQVQTTQELNQSFSKFINEMLNKLNDTPLSTSERLRCIEQSLDSLRK